ncbi:MAG: O-antigen ligase family protein [Deltaproteobacteria bacterium]|nr:O-antigen ligase family protein [Deltaproteobacteria bacterium]
MLFALFVIGALYSIGAMEERLSALREVSSLLLIPLFISIFSDHKDRRMALRAFGASIGLVLVLSYALWINILPPLPYIKGTPAYPVVFIPHLTHNILMAYGALLFAVSALRVSSMWKAAALALLSGLAFFNVFFMIPGRTGQIILIVLIFYLLHRRCGSRGLFVAAGGIAVIAAATFLLPSSMLHQRVALTLKEIREWRIDQPVKEGNSVGLRLEFYRNALTLVGRHPFFGVGAGGFAKAYSREAAQSRRLATDNPHNDYLLAAVQLGIVGLAFLLYLFIVQWHSAKKLSIPGDEVFARALVITVAVAALGASPLVDHTESLFFAWMSGLLFAGVGQNVPSKGRHSETAGRLNRETA